MPTMSAARRIELTAPCGLDCFNCAVFHENITDETRQAIASRSGLAPEAVACQGCRDQGGHCPWMKSCATYQCAEGKGLRFCFECAEFPCAQFQPAADGAATYPHNYKLFNLCRMKLVGPEHWASEESEAIRARYYRGKFVPGTGVSEP
jgi:hypothetical protein